jgi:hypothetical protein
MEPLARRLDLVLGKSFLDLLDGNMAMDGVEKGNLAEDETIWMDEFLEPRSMLAAEGRLFDNFDKMSSPEGVAGTMEGLCCTTDLRPMGGGEARLYSSYSTSGSSGSSLRGASDRPMKYSASSYCSRRDLRCSLSSMS